MVSWKIWLKSYCWKVKYALRINREEQFPEVRLEKQMIHVEKLENRRAYAFWPTNEKPLATFLVDRNDEHFFDSDILEKQMAVFFHADANHAFNRRDGSFSVRSSNVRKALKEQRRKIRIIARGRVGQAICNRPKPKLLLHKKEHMI